MSHCARGLCGVLDEVVAAGFHGIRDPKCSPFGMFAYKYSRTKDDIPQGTALVGEYGGGAEAHPC